MTRLHQIDDVASMLPLYLMGDTLAHYMEIENDDPRDIEKIEAQLKEAFFR